MRLTFRYIATLFFALFLNISQGKGYLESPTTFDRYVGWACVVGNAAPVGIHIYADGNYIGGGSAPLVREQAVGNSCESGSNNHGFNIPVSIPANLRSGVNRNVSVYLIHNDYVEELSGSPKTVFFPEILGLEKPKNFGDVVGRDLNVVTPISYLGHIGIWDGYEVIEVLGQALGNTVTRQSWDTFKTLPNKWGTVVPVISDYSQIYCDNTVCQHTRRVAADGKITDSYSHRTNTKLREMATKAAYVRYLIGGTYTLTALSTDASQGSKNTTITTICGVYSCTNHTNYSSYKATPGVYRCDTFVLRAWSATAGLMKYSELALFTSAKAVERWEKHINHLSFGGTITPLTIYNRFKVAGW